VDSVIVIVLVLAAATAGNLTHLVQTGDATGLTVTGGAWLCLAASRLAQRRSARHDALKGGTR
jgi:hypothetical protein